MAPLLCPRRDTLDMEIRHLFGIEGATQASGATVVIDVFRAFSAAAYAFAAGAAEIILAAEVEEARHVAESHPDAILMGEVSGIKPPGFRLGNSPGEIVDQPDVVAGRTVIHRSSAGTRCARAALDAGAGPLYVASLVVASATARQLAGEHTVMLVSSGESGLGPSAEDQICADLIAGLLRGDRSRLAASGPDVARCDRAQFLNEAAFAHRNDVALCAATDAFDFAMQAQREGGLVRVHRAQV